MELVSIIMPVKNAEPFLVECILSIQTQTHSDWELIIVNDHSTDRSLQLLKQFQEKDDRIKVFNNSGRGIIPALQLALSKTTGNYITRMDADDLMVKTRLEHMKKTLEEIQKPTIVTGLVKYFSNQPVSPGYLQYEKWLNEININGIQWENIYRECVISSPNWMVRKSDLLKIGGFDDLIYPEDYHLVLKWYQSHFVIKTLPETTLLWREHPDRTSRNSNNYAQEAFFKLKIATFLETDYRSENLVVWGNNPKTRLVKKFLSSQNIPCHLMDLNNYRKIESLRNPQVLIGVYPPAKERMEIELYLQSLSLLIGKDYWFL